MIPLGLIRTHLSSLLASTVQSLPDDLIELPGRPSAGFRHPFRQLFLWAVLNNHLEMAMLFWEFQDEGVALALLASQITKSIMEDTKFKQLQVNIFQLIFHSHGYALTSHKNKILYDVNVGMSQ